VNVAVDPALTVWLAGCVVMVGGLIGGVLPPPQATRQIKAPAANVFAIHIGIPPMQRLLSNSSTLQFVDYTELTAGATALRLSASIVRKLTHMDE
jgi:hypothetical protein